jgi:hypothetical protein
MNHASRLSVSGGEPESAPQKLLGDGSAQAEKRALEKETHTGRETHISKRTRMIGLIIIVM